MKISKKLRFIVFLTISEVSITLFAAFEIAKGAKFHQLNFLHLKHSTQFSGLVYGIKNGSPIDTSKIEKVILDIKQQPINCIEQINTINKIIMGFIKTIHALEICIKDIEHAENALDSLSKFNKKEITKAQLLSDLTYALQQFNINSENFEAPIHKTVSFILKSMIPFVLIISFFNIFLITYLSRTISNSIQNLTTLLSSKPEDNINLDESLKKHTSGELKELMVAARKRIKEELFNLENSKELQNLVNIQTISLRKANDELTQFAYRTSHDLKSPLSSAKTLSEFITTDIDDGNYSEAKKNAYKIGQQMEKLETLVIDILLLAQAEVDSDKKIPINFDEIVTDMEERLSCLRQDNPCTIDVNISLTKIIFSEKVRFSQIIENLISNALKYYDKNKESPYVKLDIFNKEDKVFIHISDNGIGIPDEYQAEVFTMFKRFHPKHSNGSGLGMSIVKKHIESLNGTIKFESSPQGTAFKIMIPVDYKDE